MKVTDFPATSMPQCTQSIVTWTNLSSQCWEIITSNYLHLAHGLVILKEKGETTFYCTRKPLKHVSLSTRPVARLRLTNIAQIAGTDSWLPMVTKSHSPATVLETKHSNGWRASLCGEGMEGVERGQANLILGQKTMEGAWSYSETDGTGGDSHAPGLPWGEGVATGAPGGA